VCVCVYVCLLYILKCKSHPVTAVTARSNAWWITALLAGHMFGIAEAPAIPSSSSDTNFGRNHV
jgi:hypothetical protein